MTKLMTKLKKIFIKLRITFSKDFLITANSTKAYIDPERYDLLPAIIAVLEELYNYHKTTDSLLKNFREQDEEGSI